MKWYMACFSFLLFPTVSAGQKCVKYQHGNHPIAHLVSAQKNKATSYHLGQLKAKLAKLKRELISPSSGSGGGGGGIGFDVARFVRLTMEILYSSGPSALPELVWRPLDL